MEGSFGDEVVDELERLCVLHDQAICEYEKCREFSVRLSNLLFNLEDNGCNRMADRVMDILGSCSPKVASHCEKAQSVKGMMERIRDRARDEAGKKS